MTDVFGLDESAERERIAELRKQELARLDMVQVMASVEGRRVIWRILEMSGQHSGVHNMTGNSWLYFHEGRRSIGTELDQYVYHTAPAEYHRMMAECRAKKENHDGSDG